MYTQIQLDSLDEAIASGALTVHYGDKTVTYRSLAEMLYLRGLIIIELIPGDSIKRRKYAEFEKGIEPNTTETNEFL